MRWLFRSPEQVYRSSIIKAIDRARTPILGGKKLESKTNGLRAIRRFEKVNRIAFDPRNTEHMSIISGCAVHESLLRRLKFIIDRRPNIDHT